MNDDRLLIEDFYENSQLEQDALEIVVIAKGLRATFYMFLISGLLIFLSLLLEWSVYF
jgi:hypothetical protein